MKHKGNYTKCKQTRVFDTPAWSWPGQQGPDTTSDPLRRGLQRTIPLAGSSFAGCNFIGSFKCEGCSYFDRRVFAGAFPADISSFAGSISIGAAECKMQFL